MPQNWNNILNYLKSNLGTKSAALELTDDEFIIHFKENSLPEFSQIIPKHAWILVTQSNLETIPNNYSNYTYRLTVPENINIIDVNDVYIGRNIIQYEQYFMNPADIVMGNTLNDMMQFLNTVNDYEFIKPFHIRFSEKPYNEKFIIELNIEHTDLSTIPSDMYHKLFKKMCLADGLELVLTNRNKFNNVTTPFGAIDLNFDYISQRLSEIRQKNDEIIEYLPHRQYLEIF
jgi:hypothetical protein